MARKVQVARKKVWGNALKDDRTGKRSQTYALGKRKRDERFCFEVNPRSTT